MVRTGLATGASVGNVNGVIAPVTDTMDRVVFDAGGCLARTSICCASPCGDSCTLLMGHPVITKAALKLMCRPVADRTLESDFNVSCDSEEYYHWGFILALPMVLVFTFGVPTAYALAMYWHVRKGRLAEKRAVYGFLFSGFVKNRWWFELWNTLRKSFFTMGAVLFGPYGTSLQTWARSSCYCCFWPYSACQTRTGSSISTVWSEQPCRSMCLPSFGTGLYLNEQAGESRSQVFA